MSRQILRPMLLCAVTAGITMLTSCADQKHQPATPPAVLKGIPVATVTTANLPVTIEVTGTVRARTSALVSARIPGTVSVLHVREGDRVRKGQLLAQLDSQEHTAQAGAANAAIEEARQGVAEAQARRTLADATFLRFKALYDEQALTRQEFETRQTERELAHQGVERAEARLRQAQQTGRAASSIADYTRIIAPLSGIITTKQADLGATVFPGQPLMTIEDTGSYQLELAIPESYAGKVPPGTAVQITLDAFQKSLPATVAELVPTAEPGSRTFTAKVNLAVKGLTSGMFGRGTIVIGGSSSQGILVPKQALFERGALTAVWAVDQDNIARMRLVRPGKSINDQIEILSGLTPDDRIVTAELAKVRDGAKLEPSTTRATEGVTR